MKKTIQSRLLMTLFILISLTACGGGGGGGGETTPPLTKAIVTLSTAGTLPAGTQIGGIEVTVNLPAGVTAKASLYSAGSSTMVTDAGVITASGTAAAGSYVSGVYLAGTAASTYKINMGIANANGFSTGEFAQVSCDIATGSSPTATDFSLSNATVVDLNGSTLPGLNLGYTVAFQ
jgi:hypothetical protein